MQHKIAIFVNSFVGKPGNIGLRTGHVVRALEARNGRGLCLCRGSAMSPGNRIKIVSMGLLGNIPRLLNAIRIYVAPRYRHRLADIRLFEWFAIRRGVSQIQQDKDFPVAHIWESSPRLIEACKAAGARVLLDVPITPASYPKRLIETGKAPFFTYDPKVMALEEAAFAGADRVIAPSNFVRDEIIRLGIAADKVVVIPFGVDTDMPAAEHLKYPHDPQAGIDFCYLGAVSQRKGMVDLLRVWDHPSFSRDRLHLCGRVFPQVARQMNSSASKSGGEIICPGFITPREYLPQCQVFVFPSWMEGSAKAVYEAMACGLPAIVTTVAGSIVRDGVDGFVINPGDSDGLRRAMMYFRKNPEQIKIMGARARKAASAFTWQRYGNAIVDQYESLAR